MPLLTIITAVFNNREGLLSTFASIKAQTFDDYEWIIIDGASTDGTAEVAFQFQSSSIHVKSEPDQGCYFAMNKGLERAKGLFVLFLNAGDTFVGSDTLHKLLPLLKSDTIDFIYGDSLQWFSGRFLYKAANGHKKIAYGMFGCHQSMYFRRSVIGEMRYDIRFKVSADYDFSARFLKKTEQIERIHRALCCFETPVLSLKLRKTGRHENWLIQRDELKVSLCKRISTLVSAFMMSCLRQYLPSIYSILRLKHNYSVDG